MAVKQTDKIDFVAHDVARDEALLVIIENRPWTHEGALLPELQAKLGTYLVYAKGGQFLADFPDLAGRPLHFQLRASQEPGDQEVQFLRTMRDRYLSPAGIRLSWRVIGEDREYGI